VALAEDHVIDVDPPYASEILEAEIVAVGVAGVVTFVAEQLAVVPPFVPVQLQV
jgi:hypothetical protein